MSTFDEEIRLYTEPLSDVEQEVLDHFMSLTQQAKNGEIGAKDVFADIYILIKSLSELQDEIKDLTIDELERYTKTDTVERHGFEMKVQSRKNYSYKHDPAWLIINEKRKARESLMKKAIANELFDAASGEMIPAAEIKFSTFIKMEKI